MDYIVKQLPSKMATGSDRFSAWFNYSSGTSATSYVDKKRYDVEVEELPETGPGYFSSYEHFSWTKSKI
jgi:hypothetical protein